METKILDLITTDHQLYKQWSLGLSNPVLMPVVSRIEKPDGNKKKIVFVMPSFLNKHMISSNNIALILILKGPRVVTLYFCDHPNSLFKKEKDSEFQIIY